VNGAGDRGAAIPPSQCGPTFPSPPAPLPEGEGSERSITVDGFEVGQSFARPWEKSMGRTISHRRCRLPVASPLPLPPGEGWGEGFRSKAGAVSGSAMGKGREGGGDRERVGADGSDSVGDARERTPSREAAKETAEMRTLIGDATRWHPSGMPAGWKPLRTSVDICG